MDEDQIHSVEDVEEAEDGTLPSNGNGTGNVYSYLDAIKERRQRLGEERLLTLPIPGYDGMLVARYHYVDGMYDDLKKIIERAERSKHPRRELYGQMDVLILACKEILLHAPDDEMADENGLIPIDPETTTRFDPHLAEILDFEAARARDVVNAVFRNALAVAQQNNELMEWAASNQDEINSETEGKSAGTVRSR